MDEKCGNIVGPEPMQPRYLDSLIELLDQIFRVRREGSMAADYPLLLGKDNLKNLLICRDGGRVVTHVGLLEKRVCYFGHPLKVGMLGAVGTHPDYRGRGLATRTVLETFRQCRNRGGHLMMISGARTLYTRNGARTVGRFPTYSLEGEALRAAAAECVAYRGCGPEHSPALAALHRLKPLRFIRPLEEWSLNIAAGTCHDTPCTFWTAGEEARPTAYFAVPEDPGAREHTCTVLEWGGLAQVAVPALCSCALNAGFKRVVWSAYQHERDLQSALMAAGASQQEPEQMRGTIRVLDFTSLMEGLRDYFAERIGQQAAGRLAFRESETEEFSIGLGGEEVAISGYGALAEALFGAGTAALPAPAGDGNLRGILAELLPLTAFQYDLSFV